MVWGGRCAWAWRELEAIEDDAASAAAYEAAVAGAYEREECLDVVAHWEIDDVIDPADTRAGSAR